MERELPIINIEGTDFLVDVKKVELREKTNPKNRIPVFEMQDVGNGYMFDYSLEEKNIISFFSNNEVTTVKIPELVKLDPVGMAAKYKIADITGKTDFDVMVNQEALHKRIKMGILPTISIAGHTFYADARINQLRQRMTLGQWASDSRKSITISMKRRTFISFPIIPVNMNFRNWITIR
jgi:hypothetical protein